MDNRHCHDHSFWIKKRTFFIGKIWKWDLDEIWIQLHKTILDEWKGWPISGCYHIRWFLTHWLYVLSYISAFVENETGCFCLFFANSGQTLSESKLFGNRCLGYLCFERIFVMWRKDWFIFYLAGCRFLKTFQVSLRWWNDWKEK